MADRKFLDFLDMIDGGGAGQMGDKFEGGGLYSMLGNLAASPYGSQDEERKKARMAVYGSDNIGGPPMAAPPPVGTVGGGAPASTQTPVSPPMSYPSMPPARAPMVEFGQMPYLPNIQSSGVGGVEMPQAPAIQYSVGMQYPEWAQDDLTRQTIDYLRQAGVSGY